MVSSATVHRRPADEREQLVSLTSLRFFAALLVVFQHYYGFRFGHAGVSFFYILSGFILTHNYEEKLQDSHAMRRFYWRRFARIYPLHLLTFFVALPLVPSWTVGTLVKVPPNIFLVQSFVPYQPIYFAFNAPSWSVSDEAFFYALFPLLLSKVRVFQAAFFTLLICLISISWMLIRRDSSIDDPATHWIFYINPLARLVEFVIGISLGKCREVARNSFRTPAELITLTFAIATLTSCYWLPKSAGVLTCSLWFVPASACMVFVFSRSVGRIGALLSYPKMILLGEASFVLYMTHVLIRDYGYMLLGVSTQSRATLLIASVLMSVLIHICFERPVLSVLTSAREQGAAR